MQTLRTERQKDVPNKKAESNVKNKINKEAVHMLSHTFFRPFVLKPTEKWVQFFFIISPRTKCRQ